MENKHYRNTSIIIDSIERQSELEKKSIEEAAEKLYKEKYAALENEIKEKYRKQTEYKLLELALNSNKSASNLEAEHKAKLAELRSNITSEVYKKAYEKIKLFTESDKYPSLLENSAKVISTLYDGEATVYIRTKDSSYKDIITEAFGRTVSFCEDNTIALGGIKVLFTSEDVLVDDTLDVRLEATKKDFVKNSGLGFAG